MIAEHILQIDWQQLLIPDSSILEMVARGTATYLGLFAILRIFRRPTGQLGIADLLLITVLADAAQNSMGGSYESVSSGFALIATIVFWDRLIDHLSYRYAWFTPIAEPPPAILIKQGKVNRAALRKHKITDEDLLTHLRQGGADSADQVRLCLLESDGRISVLMQ
jgi:uncharacterized membrane protein YcaP (DUF421 family)